MSLVALAISVAYFSSVAGFVLNLAIGALLRSLSTIIVALNA